MKNPFGDSSGLSDGFSFVLLGGNPPQPQPGPPLVEASAEAQEAQAAVAESGPGGPGSTVAVTASSGFTINLEFDAAAMSAPASFRAGIEQAAALLSAAITDPITVNISIDYSGTGGGAAGGPTGGFYESYSTVRADLANNASPGDTSFNSLPAGSSIAGQTSVAVWYSQLKLWGLVSPTGTEVDGSATFATDINSNLLVGVALHELTHAMGRVPYGPSSGQPTITQPDIFDFYRFTSAGNILIDGDATAPAAYFSLNNGVTKIANYGQTSDSSDFLNSGLAGTTDPFDEFYSNSTQQHLTSLDLQQLDALGFHLAINQPTTVIEAKGSTELAQVGNNYFLDSISTGTGPELIYGGAPVVVGQSAPWAPIGAEVTSTGYDIAWHEAGTDQYSIWSTDGSGNFISFLTGAVSGTSSTLESYETIFHQDLNGDGVIGIANTTVLQTDGSTSLVEVGNHYFMNSTSSGTGPELQYGGAPIVVGQAAPWSPIGAVQTATGYDVAWHEAGTDQYSIWSTDNNGNFLSFLTGAVSGSSAALESYESIFGQDLNGDGVTGIPAGTTLIQTDGSTSLIQTGNNYYLQSTSTATGPELKFGGAPVVVGQAAPWAPIGAVQTATGYDVAWHEAGTDQYSIWSTDNNGNFLSFLTGAVSGTSTTLESYETIFHQDLNNDAVIGVPAPTGPAASAPAAQAPPVTVANNDTFVFRSGLGAGATANAGSTDTTGHDGFAWVAGNAPAAALPDAQIGMPHLVFQWADSDPSHHDGAPALNFHPVDPHASGFIIG